MSATRADARPSSAPDPDPETAEDVIDLALSLPRGLIEANLRAGSALLGFAGKCLHAETALFEQLSTCRDLDAAKFAHARFLATMIDEYGREFSELMAMTRESVAAAAAGLSTRPKQTTPIP
jgi:hypothetical protein